MPFSFALAINETVEWAVGDLSADPIHPIAQGVFDIPDGYHDPVKVHLDTELINAIRSSAKIDAPIGFRPFIDDIKSVGVSTLGVVNWRWGVLSPIARKPRWIRPKERSRNTRISTTSLVDFLDVFTQVFPAIIHRGDNAPQSLVVQNDAAALGLFERHRLEDSESGGLFILFLDHGVNGGIAWDERTGLGQFNPEIGHIYPLLHPFDTERFIPEQHSGCPKHHFCYEGLASQTRIENTWGKSLDKMRVGDEAWEVIAFYAAQLALSGMLMFQPERVIVCGRVPDKEGKLLTEIRRWMLQLNAGYIPLVPSWLDGHVVASDIAPDKAGLVAALKLAQLGHNAAYPLCVKRP